MARKKAENVEQTQRGKTAARTRQNAKKATAEGSSLAKKTSTSQAKKRAVAKNAKTTQKRRAKSDDPESGLSGGCATSEDLRQDNKQIDAESDKANGKKSGLSGGCATSEEIKSSNSQSKSSKKTANSKSSKVETPSTSPKQVIYSLEAGTPIFVKTADICSATGKTNQWIGQLTAQGVLSKSSTNHGSLYSLFDTIRAYCAMLEERAKKEDDDVAQIELKRKKAEARLKESKATFAELETKEFQGKMHRSEDVQAMTADLLYFVRGSLIALAGRCANECAATSEPAEAQKIIERETSAILLELSNYKYSKNRYDELVRQRMKRELDADYFADDDEEN